MDEIIVLITTGSQDEARSIARLLVEKELVACVNVFPGVRSIFRWEGQVVEEQECLLVAKTVSGAFNRVAAEVKSIHSYSLPEVIALPIQQGLPEYLSWVGEAVKVTGPTE